MKIFAVVKSRTGKLSLILILFAIIFVLKAGSVDRVTPLYLQQVFKRIESQDMDGIFDDNLDRLRRADFVTKSAFEPFPNQTTTIGNMVRLGRDLPKNMDDVTSTFIHESVHLFQYDQKRLNPIKYLLSKKYRFEIEVEALRAELLFLCVAGRVNNGRTDIRNLAYKYAMTFPYAHWFKSLKLPRDWVEFFHNLIDQAFISKEAKSG